MKTLSISSCALAMALGMSLQASAFAATDAAAANKPAAKAKQTKGWVTAPNKKGGSGVGNLCETPLSNRF